MSDNFKLTRKGKTWQIMARKSAGAATEAAWISLGGCSDQVVAVRVWLALLVQKGRK
ncbi:hypothetical protein [Ruegeria arenilitoris]|uniref:hypothetical protein n=1 Tax=Ruegeria arenilitoris TaxID=1173585 RepID=UPI001595530A|nr:hypothetical protein [Ruegeria arenilitoris]